MKQHFFLKKWMNMSDFLKALVNFLLETKINIVVFVKKKKLYKTIKITPVNKDIITAYKKKWKQLGRYPSVKHLNICATVSEKQTENFVPENLYYNKIEPCLNDKAYMISYTDKNLFQRLLFEYSDVFPYAFLRCINGCFFDNSYVTVNKLETELLSDGEYVIKPSYFTGGGRGVSFIQKLPDSFRIYNNDTYHPISILALKLKYRNNFIVQEKIAQHPWFEYFNKSSLNTVRMLVYRSVKDEKIHILNSVLRFGAEGSIVDNQSSGGSSVGIDKNGKLNSFKINKRGNKSNLTLPLEKQVPRFQEMSEFAKKIAPLFYYHRLLGFDFAVDLNNNVKILEINCKNLEIGFHQMNNGPLFGDLTDEIIAFCRNSIKTITFNFRLYK